MVSCTRLVGWLGLLASLALAQGGFTAQGVGGDGITSAMELPAPTQQPTGVTTGGGKPLGASEGEGDNLDGASAQAASLGAASPTGTANANNAVPSAADPKTGALKPSDSASTNVTGSAAATDEPGSNLHTIYFTYELNSSSPLFPLDWTRDVSSSSSSPPLTPGEPTTATPITPLTSKPGGGSDPQQTATKRAVTGPARRQMDPGNAEHDMPGQNSTAPSGSSDKLQFLGSGVTIRGAANPQSPNTIRFTLDGESSSVPPKGDVLVDEPNVEQTTLHSLILDKPLPLVSGITVTMNVSVAKDV